MSEVQGQAATQPAVSAIPDSMNPHEATALLSQYMEEIQKVETQAPRDDKGRFTKPEAPAEEAKPEEAAPEAKAEEAPQVQEEEAQPPRKLKLKYKGEEKDVDEAEAIELAQKGYDYTQKSQALAKEREELSVKTRAEQEAARKQYSEQLAIYEQFVLKVADQEALTADLAKVAETDPAKALQLSIKRNQIAETLNAVRAERQKLAQQEQTEAFDRVKKQATETVEKLSERIPGWNNDLYGKILKSAVSDYGFTQHEANAIADHRAIEVLNDARQWREYQAAKPKTVDKKVPPVAPKVQKPGAGEKPEHKANKVQERMANLEKTGTRESAVSYVEELISSGRLS